MMLRMRRHRTTDLLAIAIGGAAGVLVRLVADELAPIGSGIPWTTLVINVAGAALLGAVATLPIRAQGFGYWRFPLLATGFCGAMTTFSALCWETLDLIDRGHGGSAVLYLLLSIGLGVAAVITAAAITGRVATGSETAR